MADVNIQGGERGSGTNAVLAVVVIALLALLAWFFFARGAVDGDRDVRVDINPPAATGGSGGGGGNGGGGGGN